MLVTGLLLGVRHGIDWDHIAAITDITSTTAGATAAEAGPAERLIGADPWGSSASNGSPSSWAPSTRSVMRSWC